MEYEYGIAHYKHDPNGPASKEQGPHRWGMTGEEAEKWLEKMIDYGVKPGAFYIIRRPLGAWERFDGLVEKGRPSREPRRPLDFDPSIR